MQSPLAASPEWAAGIFEGEGSIHISRQRRDGTAYCTLVISVSQVDREMLDILAAKWGGPIYAIKRSGSRSRQAFSWSLRARQAAAFLRDIEPFVRTARIRKKVKLGLEFQGQKSLRRPDHTPEYRRRQLHYRDRMATLNERGE